ncbi:MAG: trimethylamine methyltransferase family protein, partial [bacterium]
HYFPGPVIDRANRARWLEEGGKTLGDRANAQVQKLLKNYQTPEMAVDIRKSLVQLMEREAGKYGQEKLPERNED